MCSGMWVAWRAVTTAGLREEARLGLCGFDVVVDGRVACRGVAGVAGWRMRLLAGSGHQDEVGLTRMSD